MVLEQALIQPDSRDRICYRYRNDSNRLFGYDYQVSCAGIIITLYQDCPRNLSGATLKTNHCREDSFSKRTSPEAHITTRAEYVSRDIYNGSFALLQVHISHWGFLEQAHLQVSGKSSDKKEREPIVHISN